MTRIEKSIIITASPEKVWEMLALDKLLKWQLGFDTVKSIEYTSEVGTSKDKYSARAHRICEKMFRGTFTVLATYTLEPVEAETKFTYVGDYEMPWGIFGKFLDKLFIHRKAEKDLRTELENLKSILQK